MAELRINFHPDGMGPIHFHNEGEQLLSTHIAAALGYTLVDQAIRAAKFTGQDLDVCLDHFYAVAISMRQYSHHMLVQNQHVPASDFAP